MKNTIVVIGAGISGLVVARELVALGARVQVLEKSRGVGGRMSTKRVGDAVFDQGAQFFTARDDGFKQMIESWRKDGVVERWFGDDKPRWVVRPSMTGLAKALAKQVPISLGHKVSSVTRFPCCGCWEIAIEGEGIIRAERVVLSSPVPQSLELLDAGDVALPGNLRTELDRCDYHPCLALMLTLDKESRVPAEGLSPESGPIRWIADNVSKGITQGAKGALTVHLSRDFSGRHYGLGVDEVFERILPALRPYLGSAVVNSMQIHRWRFSEPRTLYPRPYVWLPEMRLGFCGDAFDSPRVEGAVVSGLALARQIATTLRSE